MNITPEAQRLLAARAEREANARLVLKFVGRGVTAPLPPLPRAEAKFAHGRPGKHKCAIWAWLDRVPPGTECSRLTFAIGRHSANETFDRFVKQGLLRPVRAGTPGYHGTPKIYAKV